ncbi:MAG: hypothetical protein IPF60_16175 [Betaproteobacteria bacterium]|nr:hypothetical protein [Betaproteobacteria bacterium]
MDSHTNPTDGTIYPADQFAALDRALQDAADYLALKVQAAEASRQAAEAFCTFGESLNVAGKLLLERKALGNVSADAIAAYGRRRRIPHAECSRRCRRRRCAMRRTDPRRDEARGGRAPVKRLRYSRPGDRRPHRPQVQGTAPSATPTNARRGGTTRPARLRPTTSLPRAGEVAEMIRRDLIEARHKRLTEALDYFLAGECDNDFWQRVNVATRVLDYVGNLNTRETVGKLRERLTPPWRWPDLRREVAHALFEMAAEAIADETAPPLESFAAEVSP